MTNETTALGEPKPGSVSPAAAPGGAPPPAPQTQQGGGMMSGLGGVVAEGVSTFLRTIYLLSATIVL